MRISRKAGLSPVIVAVLVGALLVPLAPRAALAATITVNTTADTGGDDGECSLREAVISANTDTASGAMAGECDAGSGADTIVLENKTYTLGVGGTLSVVETLILEGNGATIDGAGINRVMSVAGATLTVRNVTITGGAASTGDGNGGGIRLTGGGADLIVEDSRIVDNTATGEGGGVGTAQAGGPGMDITISGSTIAGNTAGFGGTIGRGGAVFALGGTLTIDTSTLSDNVSDGNGGAIFTGSFLDMVNSTISGNEARAEDSGVAFGGGLSAVSIATDQLSNVTVTDNFAATDAGGVNGGTSFTADNTVMAGNSIGAAGSTVDCGSAGWTSGGNNLFGLASGCPTDAPGGDVETADAMLGPLADNGGPTETHALLAGSPAIEAGDTTETADQRGMSRAQGADDDIGAFEYRGPLVVTRTDDPVPDGCVSGADCSLREAVIDANAAASHDVVVLAVDTTYTLTLNDTSDSPLVGDLDVTDTTGQLTIVGNNSVIDAVGLSPNRDRVFEVASFADLYLDPVTVTRGNATPGAGIAVRGSAALTLDDSSVLNNNTNGVGGGISISASALVRIAGSTIAGNGALLDGGGVYLSGAGARFEATNSTLSDNEASGKGSGIYASVGTVAVTSSTIADNGSVVVTSAGGGFFVEGGATATVANTIVAGNADGVGDSDCEGAGGAVVTSLGHNLFGTGAGCTPNGVDDVTVAPGDVFTMVLVSPLADNGGPTLTHPLLPDSPAIDAGDSDEPFDQLGIARPQEAADDIGAVEFVPGFNSIWGWGVDTGASSLEVCTPISLPCQAGIQGLQAGQFSNPIGMAVDGSGNVYVVDTSNQRVQKFDSDGAFLRTWGKGVIPGGGTGFEICTAATLPCTAGLVGGGAGEFDRPTRVEVDGSGNVYVVEQFNHRVQKFATDGTWLGTWGRGVDTGAAAFEVCTIASLPCQAGSQGSLAGEFSSPQGVAVDGTGNIYVADTSNHRVQKFDSAGTPLSNWGSLGAGAGQFSNPFGVEVDGSGNVYVAEQANHRVQKFDSTATFLRAWGWGVDTGAAAFEVCTAATAPCQAGAQGGSAGQFQDPLALAVDGLGDVYVTEQANRRVQKFDSAGSFLRAWGWGVDTGAAAFEVCTAATLPCQAGSQGGGGGQFHLPEGLAVDGSGVVYIADRGNHRVQTLAGTLVSAVDVLLQNSSSGLVALWELNATGGFVGASVVSNPGSSTWQVVGSGDFVAGGGVDVLLQHSGSGLVALWELNATGGFVGASVVSNPGTAAWGVAEVGDFIT